MKAYVKMYYMGAEIQKLKYLDEDVFSSSASYRYIKILISADNGRDSYTEFEKIEVSSQKDGVNLMTVDMPYDQSSYYTGANGVGRTASKLLNSLTSIDNIWTSLDTDPFSRWVSFDMKIPHVIKEVRMRCTSDTIFGDSRDRAPKDFIIQVSNDNSNWIDLKRVTNLTGWEIGIFKVIEI